jgi:hypothetical protein
LVISRSILFRIRNVWDASNI